MPAPLLFLDDVHLTFGGTPLLVGASIQVHPRSRMCLVGRNGSGKSTLLRVAAGMIEADRGERFVQPGTSLHYLPQEPDIGAHETVENYVLSALAPTQDDYAARLLMEEAGLEPSLSTANLSGGEARRAALARAFALKPDILLLDEPTNHLDLPMIRWLEERLERMSAALVMISHDRRFLEKLSRETLWIDRGSSRLLKEGFAGFEDWRDGLMEAEELEHHKLKRKIVREEHWMTHGVSGRRKRNMRRVRELGELKSTKANSRKATGNVQLSMAEGEESGKLVLKLFGVSKSFGGHAIVEDLSLTLTRGERLGIIGANGSGKTTLVKLMTGEIEADTGKTKHGVNLDALVIDQNREVLDPEWTLRDALTDGKGDTVVIGEETKNVYSYMQDFLFLPEQARTPVHALSGGERARLTLARGLRQPSNLLVLDEPTNDLDMETLDLLQEFLADYPGTLILVSHDRDFLDRICTGVLVSDGGGRWLQYAGGYSDMLAQRGDTPPERQRKNKAVPTKNRDRQTIQATPKLNQSKLSFKDEHALETLPKEIERLEFEISKLETALAKPGFYEAEPTKFNAWAKELEKRQTQKSEKEELWLELELKNA